MAFLIEKTCTGCAFDILDAARAHFHLLSTFAQSERATDRCNGRLPHASVLPLHASTRTVTATYRRPRIKAVSYDWPLHLPYVHYWPHTHSVIFDSRSHCIFSLVHANRDPYKGFGSERKQEDLCVGQSTN
jgi:hypothetical protein